jgi:hypothetical protein
MLPTPTIHLKTTEFPAESAEDVFLRKVMALIETHLADRT